MDVHPDSFDVVVEVSLGVPHPRDLSEREVELLKELAELGGDRVKKPHKRVKVFEKVKDLFH